VWITSATKQRGELPLGLRAPGDRESLVDVLAEPPRVRLALDDDQRLAPGGAADDSLRQAG
jgi:hypothetical protein